MKCENFSFWLSLFTTLLVDLVSMQSISQTAYKYFVDASGHNSLLDAFGYGISGDENYKNKQNVRDVNLSRDKFRNEKNFSNGRGRWQYWFSTWPHESRTDHGQMPDTGNYQTIQFWNQLKDTSKNPVIYHERRTGQTEIYSVGQRENLGGFNSGLRENTRGHIDRFTEQSTTYKVTNYNFGRESKLNGRDDFGNYELNGDEIPGDPGYDYPMYSEIPRSSFTCQNRASGYYADVETGCQAYHVCSSNGILSTFLCPNGSIFNQQVSVCDWYFNVNCENSGQFFQLNSQTGVNNYNYFPKFEADDGSYINRYRNDGTDFRNSQIDFTSTRERNYGYEQLDSTQRQHDNNSAKSSNQIIGDFSLYGFSALLDKIKRIATNYGEDRSFNTRSFQNRYFSN